MERKLARKLNRIGMMLSLTLMLIMTVHIVLAADRGKECQAAGRRYMFAAADIYADRTTDIFTGAGRTSRLSREFAPWVKPPIEGMVAVYGREGIEYISMDDFDLMARTVFAEAKTEEFTGQVAVAEVILNRVESENFPDTIEKVIKQNGAFCSWESGAIRAAPLDDECMEAVQDALNKRCFPGTVVYFREGQYHTFGTPYTIIGNHYFSSE